VFQYWTKGDTQVEKHTERWKELAEQAAKEKDPKRMLELVHEVNELLEQKERRLRGIPGGPSCRRQS
jgi:hypothetical protein